MKNEQFSVIIDNKTGYISSIVNNFDKHCMNWCTKESSFNPDDVSDLIKTIVKDFEKYKKLLHVKKGNWGKIYKRCWDPDTGIFGELDDRKITLSEFEEKDNRSVAIYTCDEFSVTVTRYFGKNGNLVENYRIKNTTDTVICINRDNFGIEVPLPNGYPSADVCMTEQCHAHIWCGHNIAWINALKMGDSEINLGLNLTKGAIDCYDQNECKYLSRGKFILEPESFLLKSGEEYEIEWELFWHSGTDDFKNKLKQFPKFIDIQAEHFTVFENENINFTVSTHSDKKPIITVDNEIIEGKQTSKGYSVTFNPKRKGEHIFNIQIDNIKTYASFMVKRNFSELVKKRAHFIIENQQCLDLESPLYGAFMVYDNDYDSVYFDYVNTDHNACRERANIALFLIKYLQHNEDEEVRHAIDMYIDFVFREFYDESTGEVFNNIGKHSEFLRLYNAPGVMLLFCEMYFLTSDEKYLKHIMRLTETYYSIGGEKFYPNGLAIGKVIKAFKKAGWKKETERLMELFQIHVDNLLANSTNYPPHEVNYEQTIVTPALQHISDMGLLRENNDIYLSEANKHIKCLERFSGMQPDYRLHEIAIRFWDDYHFGKNKMRGDTLPHHLSCLTARGYITYSRLSNNSMWLKKAEDCIRNCMCLIGDDGRGSAAYVYPYKLNGTKGMFFDPWSNDQDLILYDALYAGEYINAFKI